MAAELTILQTPLTEDVSQTLIRALNAELAVLYDDPGANHFRLDPEETAPGRGAFLVAWRDGRPIGCGAVRTLDAGTGEIKRMYVVPEARGHGVARRILTAVEAEARALGLSRVVLETGTRQLAAIALYEHAGYAPVPLFGEYCLSPDTSLCFGKDLGKELSGAPPPVTVRPVTVEQTRPIRQLVLRAGRPPAETRLPGDDAPGSFHLGAFLGDDRATAELVGVASFMPEPCPADGDPRDWRLRGMATLEQHRSRGVGGLVLDAGLARIVDAGGRLCWCYGRTTARAFYERHGFEAVGEEFDVPHSGPHFLMRTAPLRDPIRVRVFEPADEAAVVALWDRCGLLRPWNDPHKDIARKRAVQPDLLLVAVEPADGDTAATRAVSEGRVVAAVMVGYDGHRGWINYLAVDPAARRRGLGRRMMHEAEQRLVALGCPKINLQVRAENLEVLAFYEALGYTDDKVVSLGRRLIPDDQR